MFKLFSTAALTLFLVVLLAACGGQKPAATKAPAADASPPAATVAPTAAPATEVPTQGDLTIKKVVFSHGLNENMTPTDEAESYTPDQEVYVSVQLDGNPKEGVVSANYYYGDQQIADAQVDLAQSRDEQGVIFVVGGDTFAGFTLSHDNPLPPSKNYRVDLFLNGEPAGQYNFEVTQPEGSMPSKLLSATLATDVKADTYEPYEPTDTFPANKPVFLAGRADLGNGSTLAAQWFINGELDDEGTRVFSITEDTPDVPFYFNYLPANGWPEGTHKVILYINDEPVGEYDFTIVAAQ